MKGNKNLRQAVVGARRLQLVDQKGKKGSVEQDEESSKWMEWVIENVRPDGGFKFEETEPVLRVAFAKLSAYKLEPEVAARVIYAIYVTLKQETINK